MSYPTCRAPLASSDVGSDLSSLTDLPHTRIGATEPSEFSEFSELSELSELSEFPTELLDSDDCGSGADLGRHSRPRYKPRQTADQKLDLVFEVFRQNNWSLGEFITSLCKSSNPKNIRRRSAFVKVAYGDKSVLDRFLTTEIRVQLLNSLDWGRPELTSELDLVGKNTLYGSYDSEKFEAFGSDSASLKPFEQLLQESAPILLQTLKSLAEPDETGRETDYCKPYGFSCGVVSAGGSSSSLIKRAQTFRQPILDNLCDIWVINTHPHCVSCQNNSDA